MATIWYVEHGGAGVSKDSSNPGGLNDTWNAIGGEIISDDLIQINTGTYSVANGDFAVTGLAEINWDGSLIIYGETGNPEDVVIDGIGLNNKVEIFKITLATEVPYPDHPSIAYNPSIIDTWKIAGITFCNSDASLTGEIYIADGIFYIQDCIFYNNDKRGFNGIGVYNGETSAQCYAYNCIFHNFPNDGISMKSNTNNGKAGNPEDRIIEAHMCYFYNLQGNYSQGLTLHTDNCKDESGQPNEGATCKAYSSVFENIPLSYAIGHDGGSNQHSYVYSCIVRNCKNGIHATGILAVYASYISCKRQAIFQNQTDILIIEDCVIISDYHIVIQTPGLNNTTIKRSLLWMTINNSVIDARIISGRVEDDGTGLILTIIDCILICDGNNVNSQSIIWGSWQTIDLQQCYIWVNSSYEPGMIRHYKHNAIILNMEHCSIYCGNNKPFAKFWPPSSADVTYTGGYNADNCSQLSDLNQIVRKSTDLTRVISSSTGWQSLWNRNVRRVVPVAAALLEGFSR